MAVFLRKARNRSPEIDFSFCGELFSGTRSSMSGQFFIEILPILKKKSYFCQNFKVTRK